VEDNVVISNSIIRWVTGTALPLYSTCTIINNRVYQCGSSAIEVHRAEPTIAYNTLWGSAAVSGIRIEAKAHPYIHHNIIRDNFYSGISITWGSSAAVEHNLITKNGRGIDIAQGGSAERSVIRYNNIFDNVAGDLCVDVQERVDAAHNWWGTTKKSTIEAHMIVARGAAVAHRPDATAQVDMSSPVYDFENDETYDDLPKTDRDTFAYVFSERDSTREVVSSITPPSTPDGIAWDGQFLFVATASTPTDVIYKLGLSGDIVGAFRSPAVETTGLAFDGENLWVLDFVEALVFEVDVAGRVLKSIAAPCSEPQGLAYDGRYLWTFTNQIHGRLFQFDTSGSTIRTLDTNGYDGLAWDGKYLWMNGVPGELTQVDPANGHVVRAITSSGVSTHYLAYQEPYLWTAEWADEIAAHTRLVRLLPRKERISVDGLPNDWVGLAAAVNDPKGDNSCGDTDIRALYGFTCEGVLYLMLEFDRPANYQQHFDLKIDFNGDGLQEYDLVGFFPGQPERAVLLQDYVRRQSRYIQYTVDFSGSEVASSVGEVFELRFPLRFIEGKTAFYVRVFVVDGTGPSSCLVDMTDWARVSGCASP